MKKQVCIFLLSIVGLALVHSQLFGISAEDLQQRKNTLRKTEPRKDKEEFKADNPALAAIISKIERTDIPSRDQSPDENEPLGKEWELSKNREKDLYERPEIKKENEPTLVDNLLEELKKIPGIQLKDFLLLEPTSDNFEKILRTYNLQHFAVGLNNVEKKGLLRSLQRRIQGEIPHYYGSAVNPASRNEMRSNQILEEIKQAIDEARNTIHEALNLTMESPTEEELLSLIEFLQSKNIGKEIELDEIESFDNNIVRGLASKVYTYLNRPTQAATSPAPQPIPAPRPQINLEELLNNLLRALKNISELRLEDLVTLAPTTENLEGLLHNYNLEQLIANLNDAQKLKIMTDLQKRIREESASHVIPDRPQKPPLKPKPNPLPQQLPAPIEAMETEVPMPHFEQIEAQPQQPQPEALRAEELQEPEEAFVMVGEEPVLFGLPAGNELDQFIAYIDKDIIPLIAHPRHGHHVSLDMLVRELQEVYRAHGTTNQLREELLNYIMDGLLDYIHTNSLDPRIFDERIGAFIE